MPRPLEEAVVAITGASSGVGRATARRGSALRVFSADLRAELAGPGGGRGG